MRIINNLAEQNRAVAEDAGTMAKIVKMAN